MMLRAIARQSVRGFGCRCAPALARELSVAASSDAPKAVVSKRVRQHVNPLAQKYREPIALPEWSDVFEQPELPIHLDIGCARGKYLNSVAEQFAGEQNFIGVEIRETVLEEATAEAKLRQLRNIAFIHANMNIQQRRLLSSLPAPIRSVSIFHPDPWMKKRHIKRRLVTEEFVVELASLLTPGTPIYVQTDVAELFVYMLEVFEASNKYNLEPLEKNPFPIPTDREKYVANQGGDIYRALVIVKAGGDGNPSSPPPL